MKNQFRIETKIEKYRENNTKSSNKIRNSKYKYICSNCEKEGATNQDHVKIIYIVFKFRVKYNYVSGNFCIDIVSNNSRS